MLLATSRTRSKLRFPTLVVCSLLFSIPIFAKSWRVTDFNDAIAVAEDGSATVHERIALRFDGQWHGIHRFIPVEYPGPRGTNYTLFVSVTGVTDGEGGKLKYESSTSNGLRDFKIYIPDAVDTNRTVEITYTVRNGTRFFEDHDEFYWNVTGNDWPVPIDLRLQWSAFRIRPQDRCGRRPSPACMVPPSAARPPT